MAETNGNDFVNPEWNSRPSPDNSFAILEQTTGGITKRELFAAMAVQGFLSSDVDPDSGGYDYPKLARSCVAVADALIHALSTPKEN